MWGRTGTLVIMSAIAALITLTGFAMATPPIPPDYAIAPSLTDGPQNDGSDPCDGHIGPGIGCHGPNEWGNLGINQDHLLYLPPTITDTGKLLVFLCGGNGGALPCENVYGVAAQQGYHVIGLTYPSGVDACAGLPHDENLACFGEVMSETVTGDEQSVRSNISEHDQDSIVNRLVSVLKWARNHQNPGDGWKRYLTPSGGVDWSQVHLAGFSNGSSHASFMGTQPEFQGVGRVALFAGPNDGRGSAEAWDAANYIQLIEGITDTRYYGLVHRLNKADSYSDSDNVLFKVTNNWQAFGMEGPLNRDRFPFDPDPTIATWNFDGAHMLISIDPPPPAADPIPTPTDAGTTPEEAHSSVVKDKYCSKFELDDDTADPNDYRCAEFDGNTIGYEPAWRCILGTGDVGAGWPPAADAGPDQTLECQDGGGANAALDGSGSRDPDCDVLSYAWSGPFGQAGGQKPTVFAPLGPNTVTLEVEDPWSSSAPDTTLITVTDTQPPSLHVTLTRTLLWPPNHRLVRVDAKISVADSCGDAPPLVVLKSVTSDQPDNGPADGDTDGDIREADLGTFDDTFLLRAERAGNDSRGRTYTVTYTATDASGNQTQTSSTVHVPHSK